MYVQYVLVVYFSVANTTLSSEIRHEHVKEVMLLAIGIPIIVVALTIVCYVKVSRKPFKIK